MIKKNDDASEISIQISKKIETGEQLRRTTHGGINENIEKNVNINQGNCK